MKRLLPALLSGLFLLIFFTDLAAQTPRTRAYLWTRYETGDKPTQTDYRDVFASFFSKVEDSLYISQLRGVDTLLTDATLTGATNRQIPTAAAVKTYVDNAISISGGVSDGDKTDIDVSSSGAVWTIDTGVITSVKILDGTIAWADISAAAQDSARYFDSNRTILRVPTAGVNIGGSTVSDFLNYFYFTPPTITCTLSPTTTVYEVGTSNSIILSGATTNTGAATLSAGHLTQTAPSADTLKSFTSATSYADTISFTPQQGGSGQFNTLAYSFRATQAWVKGAESGTATSTTRSVSGVYPVLYGMSATDFTSTGNPYTGLTKLVEAEGDKTVTLTGSGYIYFLVPKTWSDWSLSSIVDHNGFNVTASFTASDINISSSGLTNNWTTQAYRMYKLNTTTTTSGNAYQFNR